MKEVEFWAKTTSDGSPGISVLEHMLNVGYVAKILADINSTYFKELNITSEQIATLCALHDIGKISPGFQNKCSEWLKQNNILDIAKNGRWDAMETSHGKVTHSVLQSFLISVGMDRKTAKYIAVVLGAHHGIIQEGPNDRGIKTRGFDEQFSEIDWGKSRNKNLLEVLNNFDCDFNNFSLEKDSSFFWWLGGLTTISDWIGSDENFFSSEKKLNNDERLLKAKESILKINFEPPEIKQNLSFGELFNFGPNTIPNDMQQKTFDLITEPGVYVVEAPMGLGKTEAALWASYNLMQLKKARGIYFALPTQVTSNRIHLRINEFLNNICKSYTTSKLIHGNSWLIDSSLEFVNSDKCEVYDWFTSAKRSLLAPFGVGTIDQALLGVISAKHFFIRHFALAGKVVIIDEVHSYDLYTGTLIDNLVSTLKFLGCTVIILSATLTKERREQFVTISLSNNRISSYPLITGISKKEHEKIEFPKPPLDKNINVYFKTKNDSTKKAIELAEKGGVVLWISNTVSSAQQQYEEFKLKIKGKFPIGLLHSRFPFWRREELENEWMERLGKNNKNRCGSILISTQIVEQSVDLDADLLITELAPTDMILQRIGRLWRHDRKNRPISMPTVYILKEEKTIEELNNISAKEIIKTLGGKSYVYSPYVLLRSLEVWNKYKTISIPSQIRNFLEETYCEKKNESNSWQELKLLKENKFNEYKQKAIQSGNIWLPLSKDVEGNKTRLIEQQTISLVLCKSKIDNKIILMDNKKIIIGNKFDLNVAKAIHNNLVKIPYHYFSNNYNWKNVFEPYLYGYQTIGIIKEDGSVLINGLKSKMYLTWSLKKGIMVNKENFKE